MRRVQEKNWRTPTFIARELSRPKECVRPEGHGEGTSYVRNLCGLFATAAATHGIAPLRATLAPRERVCVSHRGTERASVSAFFAAFHFKVPGTWWEAALLCACL